MGRYRRAAARVVFPTAVLGLLLGVSVAPFAVPVTASAGPAAESATAPAAPPATPVAVASTASAASLQPDPDNTVTRIEVAPNGSARWTIQIRTRLDSEERVAEFEAFREGFRDDPSSLLDPFETRMRGVVEGAANGTGREMAARSFEASASIQEVPRRWGVVTFRFTWTGFAASEGGALVVGDVFQGGFFLARNDTLAIAAPAGYLVARVDPEPATRERDRVEWVGREDFPDRRPRVEFVPAPTEERPTATRTTAPGSGPGGPGSPTPSTGLFGTAVRRGAVLVAGAVALIVAAAVSLAWRRSRRRPPAGNGRSDVGVDGTGEGGESGETDAPGATPTGATGPAGDGSEIVTDEDRVERLLSERGGRMRQADIVDALGWSESKTSRVLSAMAEADRVEKLRLGRENVIDLVETD